MMQNVDTSTYSCVYYAPLQKEAVLPQQAAAPPRARKRDYELFPERHNPVAGERAMWIAVITQALMDALGKSKTPESLYFKEEARHWLTGNSANFIMVCEMAGMHPDDIRRRAKKALASPKLWRALPGKGKRYTERKNYRLRTKAKTSNA